jgi:hypothetical protein
MNVVVGALPGEVLDARQGRVRVGEDLRGLTGADA